MAKAKAPLRLVTGTRLGPRSQRLTMANGDVAIVCGTPPRIDDLECGHQVVTYGNRASRRRCEQCLAQVQETLL